MSLPQDNHDEVTSYTGPDVFVRKWLKAGEFKPRRADHLHGGVRQLEPLALEW